jgi:hypothetical protein
MKIRILLVWGFGALGALIVACTSNTTVNNNGSTSSSSGGTSGSTPVPAADCKTRCEKKATTCSAPAADAQSACAGICDGTYTTDQLACLEAKACADLQAGSFASLCPAATTSSSGTSGASSGTSGTSSSGSTQKFVCVLNGQCFKCKDSAGVSKCSLKDGPGPGCTSASASECE